MTEIRGILADIEFLKERFYQSCERVSTLDGASLYQIEVRLEVLKDTWVKLEKITAELHSATVHLKEEEVRKIKYIADEEFFMIESLYCETVGTLNELIAKQTSRVRSPSGEDNSRTRFLATNIKTPKLKLPIFSGAYSEWTSFYDRFKASYHDNPHLADVDKLNFLHDALTDEASNFLKGYSIQGKNYLPVWESLIARYSNKRVLVTTQIRRLLNLKNCDKDSSKTIRELLDSTNECINELNSCGAKDVVECDTLLVFITANRLCGESRRLWEESLGDSDELPKFSTLKKYLNSRFRTLEAIQLNKPNTSDAIKDSKQSTKSFLTTNTSKSSTGRSKCVLCDQSHSLWFCQVFKALTAPERNEQVKKFKMCRICLSKHHGSHSCSSAYRCSKCQDKHHYLLHLNQSEGQSAESNNLKSVAELDQLGSPIDEPTRPRVAEVIESYGGESSKNQNCFLSKGVKNVSTLLPTALVYVETSQREKILLRAIVDSGSESNIITRKAVKILNLKGKTISASFYGIENTLTATSSKEVSLKITSRINDSVELFINALVINKITDMTPTQVISESVRTHFSDLQLADPTFQKPGEIDLILGAGVYSQILEEGVRRVPDGLTTALKTSLGWIISGDSTVTDNEPKLRVCFSKVVEENEKIGEQLRKFWEYENLNEVRQQTREEILCEEFFDKHTIRLADGTYQVRLPFKDDATPKLGYSRNMAVNRLNYLERKMGKDQNFKDRYSAAFNDYIDVNHMQVVPSMQVYEEVRNNKVGFIPHFYVPHHGVVKETSSTTKLRIVFDFSAKSSNQLSLNEQLYVGPTLQRKLFSIIMNWRMYKYVISGDIKQMYRQIKVHSDDRKFQRVLWRDKNTQIVNDYEISQVTFGASPAPYLAVKTLQKLSEDEAKKFPLAEKICKRDFYIDDVLTGGDSISEVVEIRDQLCAMLSKGGFLLRKWLANDVRLLQGLPPDHLEVNTEIKLSDHDSVKALWLLGYDWDTELDAKVLVEWESFREELSEIQKFQIPRWNGFQNDVKSFELIGFCDASISAYSAILYTRVVYEGNEVKINLLIAKTRVAPLKKITLPRLELCAASLLAELLKQTKDDMQIPNVKVHAFSDSSITLSWIKNNPNNYPIFIANRITKIQEQLPGQDWWHVKSGDNPADLPSRGTNALQLLNNKEWWFGPNWLYESPSSWPVKKVAP